MSTSIRSMSLLLVSLVGCVANRTMVHVEPLQREGQDVTYRNGTPVMFSRGSYSDVILAPLGSSTGRYEIGTRLYLMVAVRSRYPSRIEVSEASFRVTGNGAPARVVPAIQLEDEIHWSAAFEQVANAFSGAFRSMAAQSAGTTTYSGRVGSSGTRIEGTSHNHGATMQAQREGATMQAQREAAHDTAANAAAIASRESIQVASLSSLLQRNTVEPGDWVSGVVVAEPPRATACGVLNSRGTGGTGEVWKLPGPCQIEVIADAGGEAHTFSFGEVITEVLREPDPAPTSEGTTVEPAGVKSRD